MLNNTRFYAQKQYAFTMNNNFLHDLYAPILGQEAVNLYTKLIHEAEKQALFMGIATEMSDFFKTIGVDYTDFVKARTKLEALGLLTTYLKNDVSTSISIYSFILNEPLKFMDFVTNQKYRHLLIQKIGQVNYEKLEFCYAANRVPADAENVTVTFESIFNDEQINKVTTMNFDNLYKNIAAATSLPIVITDQSKSIIESYFKTYDLSAKEIERIIFNCIILSDDGIYKVDPTLLQTNLKKTVEAVNNVNILQNIKLNRNAQIFIKYFKLPDLNAVFNDYMTLNSEQYLRAIVKTTLTSEQIEVINKLRHKFLLSDYAINLLIDYTLFKTNGNLNEKYIVKVAQTINALGLKTLEQIYNHFHFINTVDKVPEAKVEPPVLVEWFKD